MNCGQPVSSFSNVDNDRLARLAAATPPPLAAKVRASTNLAGEQRNVTALFLDVSGSTAILQQLGEQTWGELFTEVLNIFYPIVYRYEAMIVRVQQDTLLAFFGVPVTHEDDPLRALSAAINLLETTLELAPVIRQKWGVEFGVRIGLSTGPIIINAVANDLKLEYQPVNHLINLASRIQTLVPVNTIAIAEETHQFVEPFVESSVYCVSNLEGHVGPICVYQVNRLSTDPEPARGILGQASQLIGRQTELATLLQLGETVNAGLGRTVLILSDPGMGKTRLINEWRVAMTQTYPEPGFQWFRARSQSYDRASAYHLLGELLNSILHLPPSTSTADTNSALESLILSMNVETNRVYPYLAHLLGLPLAGSDLETVHYLDPQALQAQILSAFQTLLLYEAHKKPTIILLEDLHWADPSSVELLLRLLPLCLTAPILFCLVSRFDRETHGWKLITSARELLQDSLAEIQLLPLTDKESLQLLRYLLRGENLPEQLHQQILANAEGNPLFLEEIIRMLISQGVLTPHDGGWKAEASSIESTVPASLQGLLLARIDRLPQETRNLLRVASVIGRSFQLSLLEQVLESGPLLSSVSSLEAAGLLRVTQVRPELTYSFRHALVHEAIYASLLPEDRRMLHQRVGEGLEILFPTAKNELAPLLAAHFSTAGDRDRSGRYLSLAGDSALAAFANQEAENHYRNALLLCESPEKRASLLARLGEALFNQGKYASAAEEWQTAIKLYQAQQNQNEEARLTALASRAAWHAGDTPGSLRIAEAGLERLHQPFDSAGFAALLHETARARYFSGDHTGVVEMCQQALDIARRVGDVNVQADTLATMGLLAGQAPDEAISALEQAVELAETNNLLATAARAHVNLGTSLIRMRGDLRIARKHYWRAAEIQQIRGAVSEELFARLSIAEVSFSLGELNSVEESLHNLEKLVENAPDRELATVWLRIFEAGLMSSRGEWSQAVPILRRQRDEARQRQDLTNLGDISRSLGWTLFELSQWGLIENSDEAVEILEEALALYERTVKRTISLHCLLAMLHARRGEQPIAIHHITLAQELTGPNPIPLEASWIHWAQAVYETSRGRWVSALQSFQTAVGLAIPIGLRWHWARLLKDWAETLVLRGEAEDLKQAQQLLRQSQELFQQLGAPEYAHRVESRLQDITASSHLKAAAHQHISQELAMAGRVQESFLPEIPFLPAGWQLAAALKPARQTSGDFYDFITLPDNHLGILIGDVADKGVGAALFMTLSRTLIRTYAIEYPQQPEKIFAAANQRMQEDSSVGLFVTAFYATLDLNTGTLTYVNAGHNPPYLLSAARPHTIQPLTRTGIPLGLFQDEGWFSVPILLNPGDTLVLYSDGATEAQNDTDQFYDESRLMAAIQQHGADPAQTAEGLLERLLSDIQKFMGERPQTDDLALIVVKRSPTD
jgi:serine phosphatase RsbU (regulator of sigma subunit)/predicted ATPase/class 3 adenylate cyclase